MGATTSITENRVTICLTWPQLQWLREGAGHYRIGFSEFMRRKLDVLMDMERGTTSSTKRN